MEKQFEKCKNVDRKRECCRIRLWGCYGGRLVQQTVSNLTMTDFDPIFIDDIKARINSDWPADVSVHDITEVPLSKNFDAIYTLDIMEHIDPKKESKKKKKMYQYD